MESITENYVMKLRLNFITKNVIIRNDDVTMVRILWDGFIIKRIVLIIKHVWIFS